MLQQEINTSGKVLIQYSQLKSYHSCVGKREVSITISQNLRIVFLIQRIKNFQSAIYMW